MGNMVIDDGIIQWFEGPEWDEVAADVFDRYANEVETYARTNAPWSDRTGDARSGLGTETMANEGSLTLELFHTVDYGLWLEHIQNGHFAIIMPTLERYAPAIMRDVEEAISKARRGR